MRNKKIEKLKEILNTKIERCYPLTFSENPRSFEYQVKVDSYQQCLELIEKIESKLI